MNRDILFSLFLGTVTPIQPTYTRYKHKHTHNTTHSHPHTHAHTHKHTILLHCFLVSLVAGVLEGRFQRRRSMYIPYQ
ncbi:hypothetical protein F4861DRAFT_72862 [Xylaria intraflava]|nr:hypothetical protein F4861DRAFT_72862 [Xylaria intraflava]